MICFPLLFLLLSAIIVAIAYSQPNTFQLKNNNSTTDDDNNTPNTSDSTPTNPGQSGPTGNSGYGSLGTFNLHFSTPFLLPAPVMWTSDALANEKDTFQPSEPMYASVQANGQAVTFYVTEHHETWVDGDVLTDVSGETEMLTLNPTGVQTVEVWSPLLIPGSYDVVLDANNNGVYDSGIDTVSVAQVQLLQVVPEVPFGTIIASFGMIAGVVGFAGFKRLRTMRQP